MITARVGPNPHSPSTAELRVLEEVLIYVDALCDAWRADRPITNLLFLLSQTRENAWPFFGAQTARGDTNRQITFTAWRTAETLRREDKDGQ